MNFIIAEYENWPIIIFSKSSSSEICANKLPRLKPIPSNILMTIGIPDAKNKKPNNNEIKYAIIWFFVTMLIAIEITR